MLSPPPSYIIYIPSLTPPLVLPLLSLMQKWTRLWVVARCQVSPFDSFLSHCKKESQWLKNDRSISKYALSDFTVSLTSTRKHDKVIRLLLPSLTIELSFDSQTKMDLYFKLLSKVSCKCGRYPY
jgi:hypothetical protein